VTVVVVVVVIATALALRAELQGGAGDHRIRQDGSQLEVQGASFFLLNQIVSGQFFFFGAQDPSHR
jgi:hypothetical protein